MHKRKKVSLSGPQNEQFNYIMRPCNIVQSMLQIHTFFKLSVPPPPNHGGSAEATHGLTSF